MINLGCERHTALFGLDGLARGNGDGAVQGLDRHVAVVALGGDAVVDCDVAIGGGNFDVCAGLDGLFYIYACTFEADVGFLGRDAVNRVGSQIPATQGDFLRPIRRRCRKDFGHFWRRGPVKSGTDGQDAVRFHLDMALGRVGDGRIASQADINVAIALKRSLADGAGGLNFALCGGVEIWRIDILRRNRAILADKRHDRASRGRFILRERDVAVRLGIKILCGGNGLGGTDGRAGGERDVVAGNIAIDVERTGGRFEADVAGSVIVRPRRRGNRSGNGQGIPGDDTDVVFRRRFVDHERHCIRFWAVYGANDANRTLFGLGLERGHQVPTIGQSNVAIVRCQIAEAAVRHIDALLRDVAIDDDCGIASDFKAVLIW